MLLAQKGEQKEEFIVEILHNKESSGPSLLMWPGPQNLHTNLVYN